MSKYLIINADDFGYNIQQNSAIKELLEKGLITSTSVMAVAPETKNASAFLKEKGIGAGVHLTINSDSSDYPWKSITRAKKLGGENGMPCKQSDLTFGLTHAEVRAELEAQYDYLTSRGVNIDHADNHCGTLYGLNLRRFYIDAFDFCAEHNLPYRFPKSYGFIEEQLSGKAPSVLKKLQDMIVSCGENKNVRMLDNLVSNPWNIDRIGDFDNLKKYYLDAVENCVDGVTEIFLHPALAIDDKKSEWTKRVFEYEILKSGDLLQKAEDKNIKVVGWSYFDLRR